MIDSGSLQRVTLADGRRGWFLNHAPHGMAVIYHGIIDGLVFVTEEPTGSVTFDLPENAPDLPGLPEATGYVPTERG